MPYVLKKSNGRVFVTIPDGSIDQSTALTFLGKNYAGYGQVIGQNFLYLLENFASTAEPKNPIQGQLWYDAGNLQLKIYDGSAFDPINLTQLSSIAPATGNNGDFWLNTTNNTLNIWNNSSWQAVSGSGGSAAGLSQQTINDESSVPHLVSILSIGGAEVAIISEDEFTVGPAEALQNEFPVVKKGITLSGSDTASGLSSASTTTGYMLWGTAASAISMPIQTANTATGQASVAAWPSSVAVRDTSGNLVATNFVKSDGTTIGGFTGSRGSSGFTGSAGAVGSIGPAGTPGGPIGPIGPPGYTGSSGTTGATGPAGGPIGPTGYTGSSGTNGVNGFVGSAGPRVYVQTLPPPSGVNGDFWVVTS
jgi:hypothetical protein